MKIKWCSLIPHWYSVDERVPVGEGFIIFKRCRWCGKLPPEMLAVYGAAAFYKRAPEYYETKAKTGHWSTGWKL